MGHGRAFAIGLFLLLCVNPLAFGQHFDGAFEFRWLSDKDGSHREMMLLSEVALVEASGVRWPVPKGERTDGASIPSWLWSFEGSPFTGTYRRAAVIHDYYCRMGTLESDKVHWLFLVGMIVDGTPVDDAARKHTAVVIYDVWVSQWGPGCGIASRASGRLSELAPASFEQDLGARITDEVLATIQLYETTSLEEYPLASRVNQLADLAQIDRRRTYESLVQLAAEPSDAAYDRFVAAYDVERPNDIQLELLRQLARGTFPNPDIGVACC